MYRMSEREIGAHWASVGFGQLSVGGEVANRVTIPIRDVIRDSAVQLVLTHQRWCSFINMRVRGWAGYVCVHRTGARGSEAAVEVFERGHLAAQRSGAVPLFEAAAAGGESKGFV
jgi:hypothetical protein